jgi:superfamily II RNA helicase
MIGFGLLVPSPYLQPQLILELARSPAEPLVSQIRINFSMTLNLLLSHRPEEVKHMLSRSFAAYQDRGRDRYKSNHIDKILLEIRMLLPQGRCDTSDPFEVNEHLKKRLGFIKENRKAHGKPGKEDATRLPTEYFPCDECTHVRICHRQGKGPLHSLLRRAEALLSGGERSEADLWFGFKRHLRFLRETGFVDKQDKLSADGLWASNLRVDQPLLIAEAIRKGYLDGLSPEMLSAALAPFVWDREQDVAVRMDGAKDPEGLKLVFSRVIEGIGEMVALKRARGFESYPLAYWPTLALLIWARGQSWEALLRQVRIDEGDMASLITRTADHLRQVASLKGSHPQLAKVASIAVQMILREPVYLF